MTDNSQNTVIKLDQYWRIFYQACVWIVFLIILLFVYVKYFLLNIVIGIILACGMVVEFNKSMIHV